MGFKENQTGSAYPILKHLRQDERPRRRRRGPTCATGRGGRSLPWLKPFQLGPRIREQPFGGYESPLLVLDEGDGRVHDLGLVAMCLPLGPRRGAPSQLRHQKWQLAVPADALLTCDGEVVGEVGGVVLADHGVNTGEPCCCQAEPDELEALLQATAADLMFADVVEPARPVVSIALWAVMGLTLATDTV